MTWRILRKWDEKKVFEFKKSDIYNPAFGVGSADHDPYPNHKAHQIVERRVIGNEFFIEGEHVSETPLEPGINLAVDGLQYTIVSLDQSGDSSSNMIKTIFVASHVEGLAQPLQLLDSIRKQVHNSGRAALEN